MEIIKKMCNENIEQNSNWSSDINCPQNTDRIRLRKDDTAKSRWTWTEQKNNKTNGMTERKYTDERCCVQMLPGNWRYFSITVDAWRNWHWEHSCLDIHCTSFSTKLKSCYNKFGFSGFISLRAFINNYGSCPNMALWAMLSLFISSYRNTYGLVLWIGRTGQTVTRTPSLNTNIIRIFAASKNQVNHC